MLADKVKWLAIFSDIATVIAMSTKDNETLGGVLNVVII